MHRERRWVGVRIDYCDDKGSILSEPIPYVITFISRKNTIGRGEKMVAIELPVHSVFRP